MSHRILDPTVLFQGLGSPGGDDEGFSAAMEKVYSICEKLGKESFCGLGCKRGGDEDEVEV